MAMLMASVISRALMSMPDAMPARLAGTEPVVVLVTGVLVRPSPIPASRVPGSTVSQPACATPLPNHISRKPVPIAAMPSGITRRGPPRCSRRSASGGITRNGMV